jgi:hypothetical protein
VAMNLNETVEAHGTPNDFIGHTSGNDFMIVTSPDAVEAITSDFSQRFEQGAPTFYDFVSRKQGHVVYKDRDGNEQHAPLMSLSIGVLSAEDGPFPDIRMLAADARRRATHASLS